MNEPKGLLDYDEPTHKCADCGRLLTKETMLQNCPAKQDGNDALPGCSWTPVATAAKTGDDHG